MDDGARIHGYTLTSNSCWFFDERMVYVVSSKKMMYDNLILRYMIQENYAKDNINTQQYDWSEEANDQMLEEGWQKKKTAENLSN